MSEDFNALREKLQKIESGLDELIRGGLAAKSEELAFRHHINQRFDGIAHWLTHLIHAHDQACREARRDGALLADYIRDVVEATVAHQIPPLGWRLQAEQSIAFDSADHIHPRGTINDNTRHPRFVWKSEQLFPKRPIRHLDLGCAGGGLVWDFTIQGHQSVGLEGSDISLRERRAEWRLIPDRLFTADIRYPFLFLDSREQNILFDVVTAWELFEHIDTCSVSNLLQAIRRNLQPGGMLVASISMVDDRDPKTGVSWHKTIQPQAWWHGVLREAGFDIMTAGWDVGDFARGVGNPRAFDWDVRTNSTEGFHVVAVPI